jgi:hypothetical protein
MRDQRRKEVRQKARANHKEEGRKRARLIDNILRSGHIKPGMSAEEKRARQNSVAKKLAAHGLEIRRNAPMPMGSREQRKKDHRRRMAREGKGYGTIQKKAPRHSL